MYENCVIYLSRSVDEWEIKYYSTYKDVTPQNLINDKYLKNSGVINLKTYFEKDDWWDKYLKLRISRGQYICGDSGKVWYIPDVDRGD
jgi:hypothetical protein